MPRNPLDVLAQQIVAMVASADDPVPVDRGGRAGAPAPTPSPTVARTCSRACSTCSPGRYPCDEFAELRPRLVVGPAGRHALAPPGRPDAGRHERRDHPRPRPVRGVHARGRPGRRAGRGDGVREPGGRDLPARRHHLADRGHHPRPGDRHPGARASRARCRSGTATSRRPPLRAGPGGRRLLPARSATGPTPSWPSGATSTRWPSATCAPTWTRSARRPAACSRPTARSWSSASGTSSATGGSRVLSPFGARVHAPWALAIEARIRDGLGVEVQSIWSDDGIIVRLPEADERRRRRSWSCSTPTRSRSWSSAEVGRSALFAARFRENAARALLLPRRRPGSRTPLWQQRQRAADLLAVASQYGSFPILLETYRECLRDVFDLPALIGLMADVAGPPGPGRRRSTPPSPSPFAASRWPSATWPRSCTRATPRWPSGGPRR